MASKEVLKMDKEWLENISFIEELNYLRILTHDVRAKLIDEKEDTDIGSAEEIIEHDKFITGLGEIHIMCLKRLVINLKFSIERAEEEIAEKSDKKYINVDDEWGLDDLGL